MQSEQTRQQQRRTNDTWSWYNPSDKERFIRREPSSDNPGDSLSLLREIVRLADLIFDDLAILEQYPVGWSESQSESAFEVPGARDVLLKAQQSLRVLYSHLGTYRKSFVCGQLTELGIGAHSHDLRVHIGSAGHPLPGWLNIDAAEADLELNVNWGLYLPAGSVSYIYCSHLLEHLRFQDQAPIFLQEMHRVLKKEGVARLVVPDVGRLLAAYASRDSKYFSSRQKCYPLSDEFNDNGIARLDYILFFLGIGSQQFLSFNHKFGYDAKLLCQLLNEVGFSSVRECGYQQSAHHELRVDEIGYNASAADYSGRPFSLFVEATK